MKNKKCRICKQELPSGMFSKHPRYSDGLRTECRPCNTKKAMEYNLKHKEAHLKRMREYTERNKEERKVANKIWREGNKEYISAKNKEWAVLNKEHKNTYMRNYRRERRLVDLNFRLMGNLRARIGAALKRKTRLGSSITELGCSIEELRLHLENKFLSGMTWENYGQKGWTVDHYMPLSSFNLEDPEQFKKACSYTNLQPMWAIDNSKKGSKIPT